LEVVHFHVYQVLSRYWPWLVLMVAEGLQHKDK
jgi:hypothetical protein